MPRTNDGISFPVTNVLAAVDAGRAQSNGHPHGDLPTSVLGFVGIDVQVNRLVANRKVPSNLLGAPLAADEGLNAAPQALGNLFVIAAVAGALCRFAAGLFNSVTVGPTATFDLTPKGAGISPQNMGNLSG